VSGYEICRELRDEYGDFLPILFISGAKTDELDRVSGLLLGADDYIVKPFDPNEVLARVRRLTRRLTVQVPRRGRSGLEELLTSRELEVLFLLADGHTQKKIASELVISPKTVATHLQNILTKLGVHSRAEAVALAHRDGLWSRERLIRAHRAAGAGNGDAS
jgi:two-component system, NarL family, nitrate/nitrite response regulator NarL